MNSGQTLNGKLEPPPKAVVGRLSYYLRELQRQLRDGHATTNSHELGQRLDLTDAQVRKDLAYFGQFGRPGIGYRCEELIHAIRGILGTDQRWPVVIVGVGNLGRALLGYKGFAQQGFEIIAAFDVDPTRVGGSVEGVPIYHLDRLPDVARENKIRVAILAVPATAAQRVADRLLEAGIEGVLNFAPVTLSLPSEVSRVGVDLAIELEQLTFAVTNRRDENKRDEPKKAPRAGRAARQKRAARRTGKWAAPAKARK